MVKVNERMLGLGKAPNKIRELFAYGLERKAELGQDKVYDFSIGNPSVPAPKSVGEALVELGQSDPVAVHGYTPSPGNSAVRETIAESLNRRFDTTYTAQNLYLTCGAAASIDITLNAVLHPGEEVIAITPYFPEYRVWTETAGGVCVEVPARQSDFQIDVPAVSAAITAKTRFVIIDSPNNPVGTVYTRQNLQDLAAALRKKQDEFGTTIILLSDEPYREIVYGAEVPWIPAIYENTVVCYSWSKSLSLPGERIGYILVPDTMPGWEDLYFAVCGSGRALGFICAPALLQQVIARCIDEPADTTAYAKNRELLTEMLDDLGYTYIQPDGAFYLWVKALEPDDQAFIEHAKDYELLLVPGSSFGTAGWVRLSYCIPAQVIRNSRDAFAALKADYE